MARTSVTNDSWTEIYAGASVDKLISAEGGPIRLQTGSVSGVDGGDGYLLPQGDSVVFPVGLTVSAVAVGPTAIVQVIDLG